MPLLYSFLLLLQAATALVTFIRHLTLKV
ncbi:hypothetical protein THIOKS13120003 [Thiocapsa sp. KS1]|nr:hypothetical protein THIOKS13120003 [Thiocapsa sp. KS1]